MPHWRSIIHRREETRDDESIKSLAGSGCVLLRIVANEFHSGRLVYDNILFVHDARLGEGNHLNEQAKLDANNADESVTRSVHVV